MTTPWLEILAQQYTEAQEEKQIGKKRKRGTRCVGCGKFMNLSEAHTLYHPRGQSFYFHLKEKCLKKLEDMLVADNSFQSHSGKYTNAHELGYHYFGGV